VPLVLETASVPSGPTNFGLSFPLSIVGVLPSHAQRQTKGISQQVKTSEASQTRGAGGSIKPGVERSGTPGSVEMRNEPAKRAAAASLWVCRYRLTNCYLIAGQSALSGRVVLSPVSRAQLSCLFGSWGSAPLHPRLYAAARFAGQPKLCAQEPCSELPLKCVGHWRSLPATKRFFDDCSRSQHSLLCKRSTDNLNPDR
jgi:hypothetical protein